MTYIKIYFYVLGNIYTLTTTDYFIEKDNKKQVQLMKKLSNS